MKHTTAFRYDDDEANAIQTIIDYISENAPGTNPNTSDAIRYAILNSAAEIRMESNRKEDEMTDRNDQVNWIRQTASDIASYQSVTLDDYNGDKNWMARDIVNNYLEHADELPGWMNEHDKKLLIEFTEKSI